MPKNKPRKPPTRTEIYKTILDHKKIIDEVTDGSEDIHQGWVEALSYVLAGWEPKRKK